MTPDQHLQSEIEQLEQRFAENPQGRVFAHLADVYRQARRLEEAEALVVEGLKRHPNYVSAYLVLGRVYSDWGRREQAGAQFARVLELDAQNLVALRALGDLAAERELWDEARTWYDRVLQIDPYNDEVKQALAKLPSAETPAAPEAPAEAAEADSVAGYSRYGEELLDAAAEQPGAPAAPGAAPPPPPAPPPPSVSAAPPAAPTPRAAREPVAEAEPAAETEGEITPVTETMAELYAEQGLYEDAIDIYRELSTRRPDETRFAHRIEELQGKIRKRSTTPPPLPTGPDEPLPRERRARQPAAPAKGEREPPSPVLELEAEQALEPAEKPEPESASRREPPGPSTDWMEASPAELAPPPAEPAGSEAETQLPDWLSEDTSSDAGVAGEPEAWEAAPPSADAEPWTSAPSASSAESEAEEVPLPDWLTEPESSPVVGRAERREPADFSFQATAQTEELKVRDPFAASFEATAEPRPAAPARAATPGTGADAGPGAAAGARAVAAREPTRPAVVAGSGSIGEYIAMILSSGEKHAPADSGSPASARPAGTTAPASLPPRPEGAAGFPAPSVASPAPPALGAEPRSPQVPPPSPDVTQPAPPMGGHPQGGESEDDLAQFQSWLRSLKR